MAIWTTHPEPDFHNHPRWRPPAEAPGQLPFHAMTSYPYPASEHFPQTSAADGYLLNWDTRYENGRKDQRWEFNYQPVQEKPIQ